MGKFKVGDKVRRIENPIYGVRDIGDVSAVVKGPAFMSSQSTAYLDRDGKMTWSLTSDFELVKDDFDPRKAGNDNTFKLEEGKFYRTRDGKKMGPLRAEKGRLWLWNTDGFSDGFRNAWQAGGDFAYSGKEDPNDLFAEWVDEPKFKAGDRVRSKRAGEHWQDVKLTEKSGEIWLGTDTKLGLGGFLEGELELLPATSPAPDHIPHIVAVFLNGHPAPNQRPFVHGNEEAATAEAERLASLHPSQEFGVFALVAKRIGEVTVRAA